MKQTDLEFSYPDFRDLFLATLQGMLQHNGLSMASEEHFKALCTNATGLALRAERTLAAYRTLDGQGKVKEAVR
jgi:hypothetical protein